MPDSPNPIDSIAGSFSASLADVAAAGFDAAMQSLWEFSANLLHGVFDVIDSLTTPDLDPHSGPVAAVLPATGYVGGALLLLLCLVQVGKAAMSGGSGLGHLFTGLGQYLLISATAMGVLAALVAAANASALGILSAGLGVSSWGGIATTNTAWQNTVNGVSGTGLGLLALLGLLPAAFSLLIITLVRQAAILVIAATIPILAAGLVAEVSARWFWTAIRWLLALVLLTPAVALVMTLGLKLAAGAAGSNATAAAATGTAGAGGADPARSAVAAAIAACVLLVAVFSPLALFKLFAFVDPATPSGQQLRTSMAGTPTTGSSSVEGSSQATGSSTRTRQESASAEQIESRWTQALSKLSLPHQQFGSAAQSVMSTASPVLAAAGVGHGLDHDQGDGPSRPRRQHTRRTSTDPDVSDTTPTTIGQGGSAATGDSTPSSPTGSGSPAASSTSPAAATPQVPTPPDVTPSMPQPASPDGAGSGPGAGPASSPGAPGGGGPKPPAGGGAGGAGAAASGAAGAAAI